MLAIFTGLPTLSTLYDCAPRVLAPLNTEPLLLLRFFPVVPVVLGCGSPPGPKGSSDRSLVSAVPEVSGGKMKTNGGAATSGTACGGASGGEGRGV